MRLKANYIAVMMREFRRAAGYTLLSRLVEVQSGCERWDGIVLLFLDPERKFETPSDEEAKRFADAQDRPHSDY